MDVDFWSVFHEVDSEASDRAAAIIAAAHVQDALKVAILSRFSRTDLQPVLDMVNPEGPLGTFSAQITIAYAIGVIGKTAFDDLDYIRQIRNRFAHKTLADSGGAGIFRRTLSFSTQQIAAWSANLAYPKINPPTDTKEIFATNPPDWTKLKVINPVPPRTAYVYTCEVAAVALLHHANLKSGVTFDYSP